MDRSQIPDRFKWDLDHLFPDDEAWEKAAARVAAEANDLEYFRGKLNDPDQLFRCLSLYFGLHGTANRVSLYANLEHTLDTLSPGTQAALDKGVAVMDGLMESARFIREELMNLDEGTLSGAYAKIPGLAAYKPYIEDLRRRRGIILSPEGERILALAGDNLFAEIDLNEIPSHAEKAFSGMMADLEFPEIEDEEGDMIQLSLSNYGRYRGSSERGVRRAAVDAFFGTLKANRHVLAATLAGQVAFNSFLARARGYDSAIEAYLGKDNIDTAVYENLVDTINDNLKPLHRYMALRKKIMQVDELRLFDLYVPMVAGSEREISFEEARNLILRAMAPLGPEYLAVLATGLDPDNGWIDLYPCKNKESGAFSASTYGRHPFVMMNYLDTLDDASTLAHEFGHALHSHFSMQSQLPACSRYVSFIAEIASTFNETLLARYLADNAKDTGEKLYILNQLAETIRTTIYRQTLFAEFEKTIHEKHEAGESLTADCLSKTYIGLIRRYYGDDYTIGPDDAIEWAYIPHFYWKFYVFTYATGLSAGISLATGVLEEGAPARERYFEMLKGGCSLPPVELLRRAGADMTRSDVIRDAAALLDATLDEMETLLDM